MNSTLVAYEVLRRLSELIPARRTRRILVPPRHTDIAVVIVWVRVGLARTFLPHYEVSWLDGVASTTHELSCPYKN